MDIDEIVREALRQQATDIYLTPVGNEYGLRFNVCGRIVGQQSVGLADARRLINLLKYRANMALGERRRPQLGALTLRVGGEPVFCRLSTVGDFRDRETLVIRVITRLRGELESRYFLPHQLTRIRQACRQRGLVLFAGPMGAGKTSAMYDFAREFATRQVFCIEDPVEIYEPRFVQVQVNEAAGMTYAQLLKLALRHHPEVFIIGEIRDEETAKVALNAALSGHLVLSTLHVRSAAGTPARLRNLGLRDAEIMLALRLACYQRLIPTTTHQLKILFDFYDGAGEGEHHENVSAKWQAELAHCVTKKWISPEVAAEFRYG